MFLKYTVFVLLLLVLITAGCRPPIVYEYNLDKFDYDIVKGKDDFKLEMADLHDMINRSKLLRQGGILSVDQIEIFLDSVLIDTLAGLKAEQVILEEHYQEYRTYKLRFNEFLKRRYLEEEVYKKVSVDSQEVVDLYNERPDLFQIKEHVNLYQILISSLALKEGPDSSRYQSLTPEELEKETKNWAFKVRAMLTTPDSFTVIAEKYSHDIYSNHKGGYVGWTARGQYVDPFDSVAFQLKPGEISQPYKDRDGWHILYVENHIEEGLAPFDLFYEYIKPNVATIKSNRIGHQLLDSLKREINLVYNKEIYDKNLYYMDKRDWAAILNGIDTIVVNDMLAKELFYREKYKIENTTNDIKTEIINELSLDLMILQAARVSYVYTLPDVVQMEKFLRHKYKKVVIEKDKTDPLWVPDEALVEYVYEYNIDDYTVDKPLTIQHIIVDDSVTGEFIRDQANSGVDFLDLAETFYPGEPSLRRELAQLGEIGPDDVTPEFFKVAMMTPVGETTHPIKTMFGYHVIKVIEKRQSVSYEDARLRIIATLQREHQVDVRNEFRDKLFDEFEIKNKGKLYPIHLKPIKDRLQKS